MRLPPWKSAALLCLSGLAGCATNTTYDFQNPRFARTHYDRVVVFVNSYDLGLRKRLEVAQCDALKPTPCTPLSQVIFPGEEQSMDHILTTLGEQGVPAVLVLQINLDQASSHVAGVIGTASSQSSGYASAQGRWSASSTPSGNSVYTQGNYSGTAQGHASTTTTAFSAPIMAYDRKAQGEVQLVDVKSRETAWRGQLNTSGQGLFAVTNGSFEHAQATDVARHLVGSGLVGTAP